MGTSRYFSRKFLLALLFTITGCGAFAFSGKLSGSEFIMLVSAIMGAFTAGDVALNYIHKDKANPDAPQEKD